MSVQTPEPSAPPRPPSSAIPMAILVAFALEIAFTLCRLVAPKEWMITEKYFLTSTGIYAASGLLMTMGLGDLVRRLPERQATGARLAMFAWAVFLGLIFASGVLNYAGSSLGEKGDVIWKFQSYAYFAVSLAGTVGIILAAGGFARVAGLSIGAVIVTVLIMPPPFLATKLYALFGTSYRNVFAAFSVTLIVLHAFLLREAARSSTRDLPAEPAAPFALLGSALRGRVIAMFVLIAFTLFAMAGKSLGAMKLAMIGAPLINAIAFVVFAVAAVRSGRGLDDKLQAAFSIAGGASAWCAGVLALQTPAIYQMLGRGSDSYTRERSTEMAQALAIAMPVVAMIGVVVALLAVGAHVRRLGHNTISASIAPRTTLFVILMFTSVAVQVYAVPKARSMNDLLFLGVLAAAAGIAALLVAAGIFKRASEATSTMALPTATVLPPSGE